MTNTMSRILIFTILILTIISYFYIREVINQYLPPQSVNPNTPYSTCCCKDVFNDYCYHKLKDAYCANSD